MKAHIGRGGRLVIPAPIRKALRLSEGDEVVLRLEGNELRILTIRQALKRAQDLVGKYVPRGHSLAGDLIAQRRREAEGE